MRRPRLIGLGKVDPFRNRRMRVQPEFDPSIGIRFIQAHFTEKLERMRGHVLRIRDQPVRYLDAINIRLMLLPAAVPVGYRLREKAEYRNDQ